MTKEDEELYYKLQEIFDLAWDLHINKNTQTELGGKVVRYLPSIMQQFQYACDCVENKESMRRVAWEEGYNQGYLKGLQDMAKFNQPNEKEERRNDNEI